jgi:hypothetical protein
MIILKEVYKLFYFSSCFQRFSFIERLNNTDSSNESEKSVENNDTTKKFEIINPNQEVK